MAEQPIWTDDALNRLLGARDGYIHSLLAIRGMINRFDSAYTGRFDPRHVRKIERRDAITRPLQELASQIEADMNRCQDVYLTEYARAHPRHAVGGSLNPSAPDASVPAKPEGLLYGTYPRPVEHYEREARNLAAIWTNGNDGARTCILSALLKAAKSASSETSLTFLIREYARDLRRNSSGGDDYPWEWAKATADYLEVLIERSSNEAVTTNYESHSPGQLAAEIAHADSVKLKFDEEVYPLTKLEIEWIVFALQGVSKPVAWRCRWKSEPDWKYGDKPLAKRDLARKEPGFEEQGLSLSQAGK